MSALTSVRPSIVPGLQALALLVIASTWALPAAAVRTFDFEQRVLIEDDRYLKDHTVVYEDGLYHVFYIIGNNGQGWGDPGNEIDFGHASSADLTTWSFHDRILSIDPATWKSRNLWAPIIARHDGGFLMAYTGVDSSIVQQIGLAGSTDLFTWTDFSVAESAYHPDSTWARWGPGMWSNCRDPYVRQLDDGSWMMLATALTRAEYTGTPLGALALAFSPDGFDWTDTGTPLVINDTSRVLESPFLYSREDRHYLLFTKGGSPGTRYTTSDSLLAGWDVTTNTRLDSTGFAAEIFEGGGVTWLSRVRGFFDDNDVLSRAVVFDTLYVDDAAGTLSHGNTNTFWRDWYVLPGGTGAFDFQPTVGDRPFSRSGVPSGVAGHYSINTAEAFPGPIGANCEACPPVYARTGAVRSFSFTITGTTMRLLVGGGNDPQTIHIDLKRRSDDAVLFSETGSGSDLLTLRQWDLAPYVGTEVYLEMADWSETSYLSVDAIHELFPVAGLGPQGAATPPGMLRASPNPGRVPTIEFELADRSHVRLAVYDAAGRQVDLVVDDELAAGAHAHQWRGRYHDGRQVPSGVYYVKLTAGDFTHTARVTRLR